MTSNDIKRNEKEPRSCSPKYWCEKQVAAHLNMSVQWLRKRRELGLQPTWRRFGRSIRYKIEDVMDFEKDSICDFTGQHEFEQKGV